jgi:ASC-1-like (ASCH) protein
MAFLQRIINGGGTIERECAVGRGRMDLLITYKEQYFIIEIKLVRDYDSFESIKEEGLEQIEMYRDKFDRLTPSYLMIFDRRKKAKEKSWDERIGWEIVGEVNVLSC